MTLIPTLNRIDKLINLLISLKETKTITPGFVIVDKKDFENNGGAYERIKKEYFLPNWEYRVTVGVQMGDKVREVWPEVETHPWVNLMNDDHVVVTKHWDKILSQQITGKNIVSCSDRWMAPQRMAGATMISMPLLKVMGFPIFPPGLQHLFIDNLLENLGLHTGCWDIDMSVVILHKHVLKREGVMDSTHQSVYYRGWESGADAQVFHKFMQTEFQGLVDRVNKFIEADDV